MELERTINNTGVEGQYHNIKKNIGVFIKE